MSRSWVFKRCTPCQSRARSARGSPARNRWNIISLGANLLPAARARIFSVRSLRSHRTVLQEHIAALRDPALPPRPPGVLLQLIRRWYHCEESESPADPQQQPQTTDHVTQKQARTSRRNTTTEISGRRRTRLRLSLAPGMCMVCEERSSTGHPRNPGRAPLPVSLEPELRLVVRRGRPCH